MRYHKLVTMLAFVASIVLSGVSVVAAEPLLHSTQLRAGVYFPASKSFDPGTGIDLAYSISPFPYASLDAGIGYYRAEDGAAGFISALPLTLSARAILPLTYINVHVGGGIGTYYKMAGGTTELPADHSEWSVGYHVNTGIVYPASSSVSLLLDAKYVTVNQGKFRSYSNIKHDGAFLYGGFALNF